MSKSEYIKLARLLLRTNTKEASIGSAFGTMARGVSHDFNLLRGGLGTLKDYTKAYGASKLNELKNFGKGFLNPRAVARNRLAINRINQLGQNAAKTEINHWGMAPAYNQLKVNKKLLSRLGYTPQRIAEGPINRVEFLRKLEDFNNRKLMDTVDMASGARARQSLVNASRNPWVYGTAATALGAGAMGLGMNQLGLFGNRFAKRPAGPKQ